MFIFHPFKGFVVLSLQASSNLAASSNRKDKQSNIKYAAWAAQQLKEKYTVCGAKDLHIGTLSLMIFKKLFY